MTKSSTAEKPTLAKSGTNYHIVRQKVFEQSLAMLENTIGRKGSLIDLGAGHCQFSLMANSLGWDVTALDARNARAPSLPDSIDFILADVDSDKWGPDYDVIACLGLYYHLSQEMQHRLLEKCRGRLLILDTHFALPNASGSQRYRQLSPTFEKNGEIGADFGEDPELDDETRKKQSLLASFENKTSWWQTKESLISTLNDYGWDHVWTFNYHDQDWLQRTFFIGFVTDTSKPFFK